MWTRLVAGAAAHDINNLTQGLFNLLSLASSPDVPAEALTRYTALAREGIKELQDLGRDLRTLADVDPEFETQRLDVVCAEVVSEIQSTLPTLGRSVELGQPVGEILVAGSGGALRLAIQAVLRYALAASASGAQVRVGTSLDDTTAALIIEAPTAPPPRASTEGELSSLMSGRDRALASDASLVLAGAVVSLCGGEAWAGPSSDGGLRFKLCFRRAENGPSNADRA
jgi:hypothetical protein